MSKKLTLICTLLGLAALLALPSYAEVQNIKVSGDIAALGVYRNNYDLEDGRVLQGDGSVGEYTQEDTDSFLMSITRLRVDADLTDNVGVCVRLANLREWDTSGTASEDILLDLANVTLKEMLYSPLTLVVGRQELMYGKGLIVGPGLFWDPTGAITYRDLSPLHGYDAVRAILDYDPWTLDLVAAKMYEADDDAPGAAVARDDDTDLYGVNLGYKFPSYEAEMEGYFFAKRDEQYALIVNVLNLPVGPSNGRTFEENKVYTLGLRGSVVPLENLTLSGEVAGQLGEISDQQAGQNDLPLERDRKALAANVAGTYGWPGVRFTPSLGVEYLYLSGEEAENDGDFEAWDPMYRSKFIGSIRDALENLYTTNDPADTNAWTNQHTIKVAGGLNLGELVDGLSVDLAYLHYWFDEEPLVGAEDDIGDEITMKLAYDYTEDVQFALNGAWFMPGDYYDAVHTRQPMSGGGMATANTVRNRVSNDPALSIIGSCKVTF